MDRSSSIRPSTIATAASTHLARDDWAGDVAGVLLVVVDRLMVDDALLPPGRCDHAAGVRVAVEARVAARGDLDPDLVPRLENGAGRPEIDLEPVDLARG